MKKLIPTHRREDIGVVAADGVGLAAVNRLGLKLLGLVVEVSRAVLLPLLLTVAIVPLTNPHDLHPPLLPADDDYRDEEGQMKIMMSKSMMGFFFTFSKMCS